MTNHATLIRRLLIHTDINVLPLGLHDEVMAAIRTIPGIPTEGKDYLDEDPPATLHIAPYGRQSNEADLYIRVEQDGAEAVTMRLKAHEVARLAADLAHHAARFNLGGTPCANRQPSRDEAVGHNCPVCMGAAAPCPCCGSTCLQTPHHTTVGSTSDRPGDGPCSCGNRKDPRRSHSESFCVNRGEFREASVE